jgi:hypothetical protein
MQSGKEGRKSLDIARVDMFKWIKKLFEPKPPEPPQEFQHEQLGVLLGEEGLWSGRVQRHGRDIPFVVGGTEAAPDRHLLDVLLGLLMKFPDLEASALQFLCPPEAPVEPNDFTFQSIDVLSPKRPGCFTLEFSLEGDDGAIWRVEFEGEQPKYTGRDD